MKLRELVVAAIAAAIVVLVTPATANTLTYQGVTFETAASGNQLTLTITNALSGPVAPDNWADVQYLKAFEIKDIGQVTDAAVVSASFGTWLVNVDGGVNDGSGSGIGCTSGGTPGACFYQTNPVMIPASDVMSFTLSFSGKDLNFDAPSLRVQFLTNLSDTSATGSLLSRTIPIPEPEIYAMMAVGLGLMGWVVRRKKFKEVAVT